MLIETERLALRPFTTDDDDFLAIFQLPEVARWSGAGVRRLDMTDVGAAPDAYGLELRVFRADRG